MSFHQIIPHAHHEHQKESKKIAHQHSGEDHHHERKQEDKQNGFLSYLLAIHSHTGTSNEIPVIKESTEDFRVENKETKKNFLNKFYLENLVLADKDSKKSGIYQPPNEYFNSYLFLQSLRGPPELV
ncbi:hypothetical protein DET49_12042 [Salegentibacter sp. 24]|uniref:hypothetical protein n=1 Tax=Salegentibacter sp. 24 TaxID=2183986 RepID=UPI0010E721F4|nr:hypothetical protein [Salegentibacter sp. 24]TDN83843.1 hypothetical protein DET49_12042 [Salegentibacter sp. 24]